jgi:hypothetical protein
LTEDRQRRSFYIAVRQACDSTDAGAARRRGRDGRIDAPPAAAEGRIKERHKNDVARAWLKALTQRLRGGDRESGAQRDARSRAKAFRAEVRQAIDAGDRAALEALFRKPVESGIPEEDVELELEAVHGALDALTLRDAVQRGGLPVVEHQHKALGGDRCHYVASVFLANDGSDRTGRLFLTNRRLLFLASPLLSLSWGSIASVEAEHRDLVVASTARGVLYRFRCNSFSDARCGEVIARALKNGNRAADAASQATV